MTSPVGAGTGIGEAAPATPAAWRAAALGILVGGFAVGFLASDRRFGRVVPLVTAGVAAACAIPVALASRRPPISPEDACRALADAGDDLPTFSVVVAARDEAAVLRQLVGDVGRQDYRRPDGRPQF